MAEWSLVLVLAALFGTVGVTKFVAPGWTDRSRPRGDIRRGPWPLSARSKSSVRFYWSCLVFARLLRFVLMLVMVGAGITHLMHGELPRLVVNVAIAGLLLLVTRLPRSSNRP